ncbi:MAG: hypothetical protein JKY70_10805 [Mucilaginibacter sp.]|nr:hypothetical protein [Mucilaginibacter sp.]
MNKGIAQKLALLTLDVEHIKIPENLYSTHDLALDRVVDRHAGNVGIFQ